ncbi:hypothetical protein HBN50_16055 [Halobacteriovorax sp. GB3]|uniref:inositol monophosphatase family protein n=1 Tax=Halobacteriovorax sp. GB3 TaxID=2719615 RepID=UPI002362BB17|nr:inositol monophosphatase family protein [Halobacteriovorax sp. GB3]MDD0854627.1 hypothetical protein [Halobacteriovorax sp. GB3]
MRLDQSVIEEIKTKVQKKIGEIDWTQRNFKKFEKEDRSLVTEVDLYISDLLHEVAKEAGLNFFSEEDQKSLVYPCMIVDPIDGTRELAKGIGECAISLSIHSHDSEWGWIYNPFTGFEIASDDIQQSKQANPLAMSKLVGLVSRSEHSRGKYLIDQVDDIEILPRGSIAFKLGLLAAGACDFVYSRTPKNIWDIKAGTLICKERGISLYQGSEEITLGIEKKIDGNLLWCRPEYKDSIQNSILKILEKKNAVK